MKSEPVPQKARLDEDEQQEAKVRSSVTVQVVHEAIRKQGDEELNRPAQALAWSGLAAGFSMGMSLVAEGLLQAHLPNTPWRSLVVPEIRSHTEFPIGVPSWLRRSRWPAHTDLARATFSTRRYGDAGHQNQPPDGSMPLRRRYVARLP
jgi:hypothetical protein